MGRVNFDDWFWNGGFGLNAEVRQDGESAPGTRLLARPTQPPKFAETIEFTGLIEPMIIASESAVYRPDLSSLLRRVEFSSDTKRPPTAPGTRQITPPPPGESVDAATDCDVADTPQPGGRPPRTGAAEPNGVST